MKLFINSILKLNTMKTISLKKAFHLLMVSALIITTTLFTKNVIHAIKHLYEMENGTNILSLFF